MVQTDKEPISITTFQYRTGSEPAINPLHRVQRDAQMRLAIHQHGRLGRGFTSTRPRRD